MSQSSRFVFGEWLRSRRVERQLSLRRLADEVEVHYAYLSQLERGVETPSEAVAYRLAAFFNHPAPEELLLLAGRIPSSLKQALLYNPTGAQAILRRYAGRESANMSNDAMKTQWQEEARRQWIFHVPDSILALKELGEDVDELQTLHSAGQSYMAASEYGLLWRQIAIIRQKIRARRGLAPVLLQSRTDAEMLTLLRDAEERDRPSTWEGMREAVPAWPAHEVTVSTMRRSHDAEYRDRTMAGWLGKIIGGALGTPVEGWSKEKIAADHGEIQTYLRKPDTYNDDTTFQLTFISAMEKAAGDATSWELGLEWVERIPMACTAEEIAMINLRQGIAPPLSAWLDNPYAEWIGAQMRGEVCGFVAPGDPARAATLAWRDAQISHVREGMYGEIFNAVVVSLAYNHQGDLASLVEQGLRFVPAKSLFARAVRETMEACAASKTWQEAWTRVVPRWVEPYHWVHTLSNIPAVIVGLWFGWGDFGRTIAITTQCGLDTDCNAGQSGAIAGVLLGTSGISKAWRDPIGDVMESWVVGMERIPLEELVDRTCRLGGFMAG